MAKLTAKELQNLKGKRKITMSGALDYFTAKALEISGIDIIATGAPDVETIIKGYEDGNKGTLEEALLAIEGVRRGAPNTFLMVSPPYGSTFISDEETLRTVTALIKAGADATMIQGTGIRIDKIKRITQEGIPCAGHIGLTPWYVSSLGGFRSIGKKSEEAVGLYEDALKLQEAGALYIELECIPYRVAAEITKRIKIPTIGIGSGPFCDGQVQVSIDLLGMHDSHYPKHSRKYLNIFEDKINAFKRFKEEVDNNIFPQPENSFEIEEKEFESFLEKIDKPGGN